MHDFGFFSMFSVRDHVFDRQVVRSLTFKMAQVKAESGKKVGPRSKTRPRVVSSRRTIRRGDAVTLGRYDVRSPTWELLQTLLDCFYLELCPLRSMSLYHHSGTLLIEFLKMELLELELVLVSRVAK